jgi:hypothetical protein
MPDPQSTPEITESPAPQTAADKPGFVRQEKKEGWRTREERELERVIFDQKALDKRLDATAALATAKGEMRRLVDAAGVQAAHLNDEQNATLRAKLSTALDTMASKGDIRHAAKDSGLSVSMLMRYRSEFPQYDELWSLCQQVFIEMNHVPELSKRALNGPGDKNSLMALTKLLEATRPQQYGKHVNVSGAVTHDHVMQTVLPKNLKSKFKNVPGREMVYEIEAKVTKPDAADNDK